MRKVIRNGKVAVIYSPEYGGGFYTWNSSVKGIEELIYLPELVELIEQGELTEHTVKHVIDKYSSLNSDELFHIEDSFAIAWLSEGTLFTIKEYDGSESISVKDNIEWLQA